MKDDTVAGRDSIAQNNIKLSSITKENLMRLDNPDKPL